MPRKPKTSPDLDTPAKNVEQGKYWLPSEAGWGGFINVRMTEQAKEDFFSWESANAVHIAGYVDDHIGEGIKLGLAYDRENECVIVTYTGKLVAISPDRFCCTSRAGTTQQALALAVYKHEVMAEGDYIRFGANAKGFLSFG